MKIVCFVSVFCLTVYAAHSQNFEWAKSFGGALDDNVTSVALDKDGNLLCVGTFGDTVDFNPDTTDLSFVAQANFDGYISKYDHSGNLLWAKQVFESDLSFTDPSVATDSSNNIYVASHFSGTIVIGADSSFDTLTAAGYNDAFVMKLNGNGNFLWVRRLSGTSNSYVHIHTIQTDSLGNIYCGGDFKGGVDLDPSSDTLTASTAGILGWKIFILKLSTAGDFVWGKTLETTGDGVCDRLRIDQDRNIILSGSYYGVQDFDPDSGVWNMNSILGSNFILKLDSVGGFKWVRTMNYQIKDIAVDPVGNVSFTGQFANTIDLDPGIGTMNVTSAGNTDSYVAKYDAHGNLLWGNKVGGPSEETSSSIAVDPSGNIFVSGTHGGTTDFNPGVDEYLLDNNGGNDAFVLKLDSVGHFVWAIDLNGNGTQSPTSLAVDVLGNTYLAGSFDSTTDFNPGISVLQLSSHLTGNDAFLLKLGTVSCADATYFESVAQSDNLLLASSGGNGYQWINCATGLAIQGATNALYSAPQNGLYQVLVTFDINCTALSDCYTVTTLDDEETKNVQLRIYPNPTTGDLFVDCKGYSGMFMVSSLMGQNIVTQSVQGSSFVIGQLPIGMHLYKFVDANGNVYAGKITVEP